MTVLLATNAEYETSRSTSSAETQEENKILIKTNNNYADIDVIENFIFRAEHTADYVLHTCSEFPKRVLCIKACREQATAQ